MDHSDKNYLHKTIPTSTNILKPLNNLLRHTNWNHTICSFVVTFIIHIIDISIEDKTLSEDLPGIIRMVIYFVLFVAIMYFLFLLL